MYCIDDMHTKNMCLRNLNRHRDHLVNKELCAHDSSAASRDISVSIKRSCEIQIYFPAFETPQLTSPAHSLSADLTDCHV